MKQICTDLRDEYEWLDNLVAPLSQAQWNLITPFMDWSIKTEIAHLAYFDGTARLAATDAESFKTYLEQIYQRPDKYMEDQRKIRTQTSARVLEIWRKDRKTLVDILTSLNRKDRLPWYGPSMSALSFATARLMETWAHGQDVVDTLGTERAPTDRLGHISHLGVSTFGWSYINRGREVPDVAFRVELTGPSGIVWSWGPEAAAQSIFGTALDFCLVVVQRRHVDDTNLEIKGNVMRNWMLIAQAFAGPPVTGPEPGQRVTAV